MIVESSEREAAFKAARAEADALGLPLVNYGCGTLEPYVSLSDMNLDVVPRDVPRFTLIEPDGPVPLGDGGGVVYASHVLEHVGDPDAVLAELVRVGPTYIVLPKWWNPYAWLSPGHRWMLIGEPGRWMKVGPPQLVGLPVAAALWLNARG